MDTEWGEYELALRAREGDPDALGELIERTRMRLFASAYAELRHYEDAQDAVAAALLQICLHVGQLREPARVGAWMQRIVQNEVRRIVRGRGPEVVGFSPDEAGTAGPDPSVLRLDIEQALRQLPRDQARALSLFYLSGLSIREIAQHTGRPQGTITRWLHLGRRQLAAEMEEYAPMPPDLTAAIIGTDLEPRIIQRLTDVLLAAGFARVQAHTKIDSLTDLYQVGQADWPFPKELHFPPSLESSRFVLIDEWVAGRSAFELFNILKATPEGKETAFCLLIQSPARQDSTVFAAWASGFDLCFAREAELAVLQRWFGQIRESLVKGWGQKRRRVTLSDMMKSSFAEVKALVDQMAPEPAGRPKRILVVDDEPAIVRLLERNLIEAGYEVVTAFDGLEALRKIETWRPGLVVLDDVMPGMDGAELLRRLKSDPATAGIAVLVIASRAKDADVFRNWQGGVDGCLTKPVNPAEFMTSVRQILGDPGSPEPISPVISDDNSPIVRIAHTIIQQAIMERASEMRVEPRPDCVAVWFRLPATSPGDVDGELHEAMKLPKHLERNLIARYKLMSDMNIEQHTVPQHGRIAISHAGRDYDFHVRSQPTAAGESITLEIRPFP